MYELHVRFFSSGCCAQFMHGIFRNCPRLNSSGSDSADLTSAARAVRHLPLECIALVKYTLFLHGSRLPH